ncbi:MAG: biotin--[acetyl-CoA-carboxylase] ligase [Bacteroidetes bacterium RBG_13_42_15]|nr:MAG: biotin--[acetyl-CoA-carboxylase] ligase [Bacteroidetes bacterium RBG_13_42_15]
MIIGTKLIFCKNIESTNTCASALVQSESVPEGTIIHTNFQSAGRGQKGNRWVSEDGKNLLFSIVLFPEMVSPKDQFIISMFVSLGICDFLKTFIPYCKIKWPNDIYAGDDKIAGILIENSLTGNSINSSVAGIGLNINQVSFPGSIPNPVSLKMLTGKDFDPDLCLKQLAGCLDKRYKQVISEKHTEIRNEYVSSLYRLNEWHGFKSESGIFEGRIVSVTDSGFLIIEDSKAEIHEFSIREVDFVS